MEPLRAIVLAGGAASRLSGVDKPMLDVGGTPLLARVISALRDAEAVDVVVVGPRRAGINGVRWAREVPPGGGPVAAIAAGLTALSTTPDRTGATTDAVTADSTGPATVAVLAADLPWLSADTMRRLLVALNAAGGTSVGGGGDIGVASRPDGAVLVDADGVLQWLTGVWRMAALRGAIPTDPVGRSLRATLGALRVARVPGGPAEVADVDTPEDLRRARER